LLLAVATLVFTAFVLAAAWSLFERESIAYGG
jgi:hypothetical protein